ncbi:MAG TPA: hypothetical protein VK106_01760 [Balneolaceae bacterium]|nr:hypothetical protein [Balneolaceae bacterium]
MLIFISSGIFISSFHYHGDLEWNHPNASTHADAHLSQHNIFCPICVFRLNGDPVTALSPIAFQNTISVIHVPAVSIIYEQYIGPLNGRSPPALV